MRYTASSTWSGMTTRASTSQRRGGPSHLLLMDSSRVHHYARYSPDAIWVMPCVACTRCCDLMLTKQLCLLPQLEKLQAALTSRLATQNMEKDAQCLVRAITDYLMASWAVRHLAVEGKSAKSIGQQSQTQNVH